MHRWPLNNRSCLPFTNTLFCATVDSPFVSSYIMFHPHYMVMRSSKMSLKSKIWLLFFWHFLLEYCLGFNLVKTPQRLGNWFQRYKQLKDWTNNKKQKKLSALFGCILKTAFASSDSFCLIIITLIKCYTSSLSYLQRKYDICNSN